MSAFDQTRVLVQRDMFGFGINMLIAVPNHDAPGWAAVGEVTMAPPKETREAGDPSLVISVTAAQKLMDMLWDCGIRPTEGTGSAGAMAATQKHLDDMRRLVFDFPRTINFERPQ